MMQSDGGRSGFKIKSSVFRFTKRTESAAGFAGKMVDKRMRDAAFNRVEKLPLLKTTEKNVRRPPGVAIVAAAPADKSSTSDEELVGGNDEPLETYKPTWTVENYTRLLRGSLMKECKSHLNDNCRGAVAQSMTSTSELEKDAVAALVKRATNAIQVPNNFYSYFYEIQLCVNKVHLEHVLCDAFK